MAILTAAWRRRKETAAPWDYVSTGGRAGHRRGFQTRRCPRGGPIPSTSSDIPPPPSERHPAYLQIISQHRAMDTWPRASVERATMNLCNNDHACPVCGRPMRLLTTIRHVPDEQTLVLQCRPCGLSTNCRCPRAWREHALKSVTRVTRAGILAAGGGPGRSGRPLTAAKIPRANRLFGRDRVTELPVCSRLHQR
jgi:hypothetical protein